MLIIVSFITKQKCLRELDKYNISNESKEIDKMIVDV